MYTVEIFNKLSAISQHISHSNSIKHILFISTHNLHATTMNVRRSLFRKNVPSDQLRNMLQSDDEDAGSAQLPSQLFQHSADDRSLVRLHRSTESSDDRMPDQLVSITGDHQVPKMQQRATTRLFTGSTYHGTWNQFGFNGQGTYRYAGSGVEYDGHFSNGHFHGHGTLTYQNGTKIHGYWHMGNASQLSLQFSDGLLFSETDWLYLTERDRRFAKEEFCHLAPIDQHLRMPMRMNRPIPKGCFNAGDGFYNPTTKCLYSYEDPEEVVRIPTVAEEKWIVANCLAAAEDDMEGFSDVVDKALLEDIDYATDDEEFMYTAA